MSVRGKLSAGIAVVTAILAFPALASAETRYAMPDPPLSASCSVDDPCALDVAVSSSMVPGDVVVVTPGEYIIEVPIVVLAAVTVRGQAGAARPLLRGNTGGAPLVTADAAGASLRHLAMRHDGNGGVALRAVAPVVLDDLFLQAAGQSGTAAQLGLGATLSNSVAWASSAGGYGVHVVTATAGLHNVTAWASGGDGRAIRVDASTAPTATNTIARAPSGTDVETSLFSTLLTTNSNYATTAGPVAPVGAGNRSAFPALVAPDSGDFHQLHGSPTLDAGIPDPVSMPNDFDGEARVLGAAPDVGADELELQSPAAITGDAADITANSATLTGTVDPNGLATTYRFEYGPTPLYGNLTPVAGAGTGGDPVPVAQPLTGLEPGAIVHYRLVASNPDGVSAGLDRILVVSGVPQGDTTPHITALTLPSTATVGEPVQLQVRGRDPNGPLNSIVVDFGDGESFFAESACRRRPRDPAFRPNRPRTFSVPYSFARAGLHTVTVTLGSSGCGRSRQTISQTVAIEVLPAGKRLARVRASQTPSTAGAACRNADLPPTRRNRRKVENATVCVLNHVRRQNGMKPFRKNRKLRRAGILHNRYMLRGRFFAHQGPGEPSLGERMRKVRYRGGAGENLGAGAGVPYGTARGMVDGWMNSPVHRANILEKAFRTVGVAVAARKPFDPAVPGATYTAEFGTTRR